MPNHPVHFVFHPALPPVKTEAASRRRIRHLERAYPSVHEWCVCLSPAAEIASPAASGAFEAHVCASSGNGSTVAAEGWGAEPFGALLAAFNALEVQLEEESSRARHRAGEWLSRVRMRMAHNMGMSDEA